MIIAIDGSAASGKGTLAKKLAKHFGLSHLDTGALYRAVGLQLLNAGQNSKNISEDQCVKSCFELDITLTTSPLIRSENVAEMASVVAAMPTVRAALLDLQRQFAAAPPNPNGAILDGQTNSTLKINNATNSDAGTYSVLVSNGIGSVQSSDAVITVFSAPEITEQPVGAVFAFGSSAELNVKAESVGAVEYQ